MADFIKNNGDLLKSIIGLIAAIIPLVILTVTYLRNRSESTKEPVDSQSIKAIQVKRYPVDEEQWEEEHKKAANTSSLYVVFSVLIYIAIAIYMYINFSAFLIKQKNPIYYMLGGLFFIIIISIFFTFGSFVYSKSYIRSSNRIAARCYFFKDVDIIITANHHYLFSKCLNVLKSMKYQIAEADEKGGFIEAQTLVWLNDAKSINVFINKVEGSKEDYKVTLSYDIFGVDDFTKSKVSNRFIDGLISKPKAVDNKAKSEEVQIKEGEG